MMRIVTPVTGISDPQMFNLDLFYGNTKQLKKEEKSEDRGFQAMLDLEIAHLREIDHKKENNEQEDTDDIEY